MEPVYTSVIAFARTLFAAQGLKFTITGAENFPRTGGGVVAMNHIGYFDFAYVGLAALNNRRLIRFMCKDTIFDHPVAGPLMRGMKHIPVDRSSGGGSFRTAVQALRAGELVGVFPEATISRSFELKEFKSGVVRMAQAGRAPIIPVTLWGSQRVWTKGRPKRLGRTNVPIVISVGPPIEVGRHEDPGPVLDRLRRQMTTMLHTVQDSYPPLHGDDLVFQPARLGGLAPTLAEAAAVTGTNDLTPERDRGEGTV